MTRSPPTAPGSLSASGGVGSASLSWTAASDAVGVVRYNVHRGTTAGFTPSLANRIAQPTGLSYTDTVAAGSYFYRVTAEDAAGNVGTASNEAAATVTTDTTPPTAPSGLAGTVTGSTVALTWSAASDNVAVVRYNLHRSTTSGFTPTTANRIAQPTGLSHSDTGLATGSYFYKVTAEDAAGNISVASNQAAATVADATPPSAPGTLTATAAGTSINLSWGAATDTVGVVRYNLHRGSTSGFTPSTANRIAQPTGLSHSDTSLAPGTYFYKATAEDAAGNIGPVSNTASATVTDTTPPTTPTLNATGGAGQASLSWTAATDNVAVLRYNLHRSTTSGFTPSTANRIAQPTGLSHTDSGLSAGTYFYKLTAEDAAGNLSPASNQASATVTTAPPPAWSPPTASTKAAAPPQPTNPGTKQRHAHQHRLGRCDRGQVRQRLSFNGSSSFVRVPDANSTRPDERDDDGGVGAADRCSRWADRGVEGERRLLRLGAVWQQRVQPARRPHRQHGRPRASSGPARSRPTLGATSPPPTTAPARALPERQPDLATAHQRPHGHHRPTAQDRRQRDLGRVVQRPHRRSACLQPRPHRRADRNRHVPESVPGLDRPDADGEDTRPEYRGSPRGHVRFGNVRRADQPAHDHELDVPAQRSRQHRRADRLSRTTG